MYCIEKTCDIVGTYRYSPVIRRAGLVPPFPPRYTSGVILRDKVRSCEVRRALNVEPLLRIERAQLRWFGHVSRMPHQRLSSQVLLAKPTRKPPIDCSRPRWSDYISDLAWSRAGVEPVKLFEIVFDRGVFQVLLGLLPPATLPESKADMKMNEMNPFASFSLFTGVQKFSANE